MVADVVAEPFAWVGGERQGGLGAHPLAVGRRRRLAVALRQREHVGVGADPAEGGEGIPVLLAVAVRHGRGIDDPGGVGEAVADGDAALGRPRRHRIGGIEDLRIAVLGQELRHRIVRRQQAALVQDQRRHASDGLGVGPHAEQRVQAGRGVFVQVEHAAGMVVDDASLTRNERHQIRHAAIVDERLHGRADARQTLGVEPQLARVAGEQWRIGHGGSSSSLWSASQALRTFTV